MNSSRHAARAVLRTLRPAHHGTPRHTECACYIAIARPRFQCVPDRQFRVRYWGVTGTLARSLLPGEIADKLAAAIRRLLEDQVLDEIVRSRADLPTIRRYLEVVASRVFAIFVSRQQHVHRDRNDRRTDRRRLRHGVPRSWIRPRTALERSRLRRQSAGRHPDHASPHRPYCGDSVRRLVLRSAQSLHDLGHAIRARQPRRRLSRSISAGESLRAHGLFRNVGHQAIPRSPAGRRLFNRPDADQHALP